MKHKRINKDDIYISPVVLVQLFDNTRKEVGNKVFTSRKYKVLREAWIASLFSIGLSTYEGGVWWLRPNPEDDAPDFFAFNTRKFEGADYLEGVNASFEVFEWGKNSQEPLIEAIRNKIKDWKAESVSIICYASKENQKINFKEIYEELKNDKINVLDIWILVKVDDLDTHCIFRVYPDRLALPVPHSVPNYFVEPFSFVTKIRGRISRPGVKIGLNSEMEFTIYPY